MRLLDTSTIKLHEFHGDIPYYVILSHRWGRQEVSFDDMMNGKASSMAAFAKFKMCCGQAAADGWEYVWIDTCCIKISSSAELSESINSMYQWYSNSQVCYAYLSDVPQMDQSDLTISAFRKSTWFTRGWTLQELLAPTTVIIFNHDWIEIGTKSNLHDVIVSITGIKPLANFEKACVAQKMSWASERQTSREEDIAYCLMGLFGVNIPLLYGERQNAFRRLQLEILNNSDDESIFAWKNNTYETEGLLTSAPYAFKDSGDVQRTFSLPERPPLSMTNKGLRIELLLIQLEHLNDLKIELPLYHRRIEIFVAPLDCKRQENTLFLAIGLGKGVGNQFCRLSFNLVSLDKLYIRTEGTMTQLVYIKQNQYGEKSLAKWNPRPYSVLLAYPSLVEKGWSVVGRHGLSPGLVSWNRCHDGLKAIFRFNTFLISKSSGVLLFRHEDLNIFGLIIVIDNPKDRASVNFFIPPNLPSEIHGTTQDLLLEEILDHFSKIRLMDASYIWLDRTSLRLREGLSVNAALRKRAELGEMLYLVEITTSKH